MKVTIDFSKCRLHKETPDGLIITGSKPVKQKRGGYGTDSVFLAYNQIEIVSHVKNKIGNTNELHIKIPKWLFDVAIEGKKDIIKRIKIVEVEKEESDI